MSWDTDMALEELHATGAWAAPAAPPVQAETVATSSDLAVLLRELARDADVLAELTGTEARRARFIRVDLPARVREIVAAAKRTTSRQVWR